MTLNRLSRRKNGDILLRLKRAARGFANTRENVALAIPSLKKLLNDEKAEFVRKSAAEALNLIEKNSASRTFSLLRNESFILGVILSKRQRVPFE